MKSSIKTPEQAFAYINLPFALPEVAGLSPKHGKALIALYQLYIITEALNKEANKGEDWQPDYDGSEWHYFPYFRMDNSGSGFRFFCSVSYCRYSTVGSRLEFKEEETCDYAAETFLELYREAFVLMPQLASKEAQE